MMPIFKIKILHSQQDGFAVSIITFFVLIIMLTVGISMSSLIFYRQRISTNSVKSNQSYYASEAGIEDALLQLNTNPNLAAGSYNLTVGEATSAVTISSLVGGSRTVTSQGDAIGVNRTVQAVYSFDGVGVSFNYGAQIGAGGLQMANSSVINGNVFSNGSIAGSGSASITNDAIVAGNNNSITGMDVGGNIQVYSCINSNITGNLTYVVGGTNTCAVGGTTSTQSTEIASQPLPIDQSKIDDWKTEATNGGNSGSITLSGSQTMSLGPEKITGNLTLSNSAVLTLTGTVYVTGNITISNSATIQLDSSYGENSGVIIADGLISPSNSSVLQGSGQTGSYLMVLSTNSSDSAIVVSNSATAAIFYASSGCVNVSNSFAAKEVVAYKLIMNNSATITYESGLINTFFSSGPSAGWQVTGWEEK